MREDGISAYQFPQPSVLMHSITKRRNPSIFLSVILAMAILVTGCDDTIVDPPGPDPTIDVSAAFSMQPSDPRPGDEVTLDGSASTATGGATLSYSWSLSAPSESAAELDNPTAESTSFVVDIPGVYEVTLQVSAEGESDTTVDDVEVHDAEVEDLSGNISSDKTLHADILYRVVGSVNVTGGTFTIEAGTRVEFEQGTGIRFGDGSTIVAQGTAGEPILLTGTQETPGWWQGVWLEDTRHPNNSFDYVTIEYGGGEAFHGSIEPANLALGRNLGREAATSMQNTTLRHSGGYGLAVYGGSTISNSDNNTLTQNSSGAAHIFADVMGDLDAASSFTGNLGGNDFVRVTSTRVSNDVTWAAIDAPFFISGELPVDAHLTIDAGATFAFDFEAGLVLESNSSIRAQGTETDPIVFTGSQETVGWWNGIWLQDTSHPDNVFEHVVVEYGGGSAYHTSVMPGNLVLGRNLGRSSTVAVRNSTFRHSASVGLYIHEGSALRESSENTFTLNGEGAAGLSSSGMGDLDAGSDFTGNVGGNDIIIVRGNDVDNSATWQALNATYQIDGRTRVSAGVTIDPGAIFAFEQEAELIFQSGSMISAEGTAAAPIVFTGTREENGWWRGVWLEDTRHPDNVMSHVVIEYGGSSAYHASVEPANLVLGRNLGRESSLELTDATLRESGGVGLFVHTNSSINADVCDANDFVGTDCVID
jgi:hypothetical protein